MKPIKINTPDFNESRRNIINTALDSMERELNFKKQQIEEIKGNVLGIGFVIMDHDGNVADQDYSKRKYTLIDTVGVNQSYLLQKPTQFVESDAKKNLT